MNVQLATVVSDVAGETGQKILRAIVAGERDGQRLAAMKNAHSLASSDEIAKSLQASDRREVTLFLRCPHLSLPHFYMPASRLHPSL